MILDGLELGKVYFSENFYSNLWNKGLKHPYLSIWVFNKFLHKNKLVYKQIELDIEKITKQI